MKFSRQREFIYRTVLENPVHPTADSVYAAVRAQEPNISLATVYRNLNLLAEQGRLQKICIPNASDRFDGRLEKHYHMLCDRCGELSDIEPEHLSGIEEQIQSIPDFQVTGYHLLIHGVCDQCADGKKH